MKRMYIVSMDCGARCWGDILIEFLRLLHDYEVNNLHKLTDGIKAERGTGERAGIYNTETERLHSALRSQLPAEV